MDAPPVTTKAAITIRFSWLHSIEWPHRSERSVREHMLEQLLTGEVLEVRVVDPTLAYLFIGQGEDVLEQQKTDHEAGLDPGRPLSL